MNGRLKRSTTDTTIYCSYITITVSIPFLINISIFNSLIFPYNLHSTASSCAQKGHLNMVATTCFFLLEITLVVLFRRPIACLYLLVNIGL